MSPHCALPGVVALARTRYSHRVYPVAAALHALLDHAYQTALNKVASKDRRLQQVHTCLQMAREERTPYDD